MCQEGINPLRFALEVGQSISIMTAIKISYSDRQSTNNFILSSTAIFTKPVFNDHQDASFIIGNLSVHQHRKDSHNCKLRRRGICVSYFIVCVHTPQRRTYNLQRGGD